MPKPTFFNLSEKKRSHIANVAIDAFSRAPYSQVSVSGLVAAAGIAKGSFYQYFEDKLDLYRWLVVDVIARQKLAFMKDNMSEPTEGGFFGELERMTMLALDFGLAHPVASRMAAFLRQDGQAGGPVHELHTELDAMVHRNVRTMLEQGLRAGHIRADVDLEVAADFFISVSREVLDSALRRRLGVDLLELCSKPELAARFDVAQRREFIHGVVDLLRRGLGPHTPPAAVDGTVIHMEDFPEPGGSGP